jgi:hypothetical protein
VTSDWQAWREDVPWMTLYFTVAVWFSIAIPHVPIWSGKEGKPPD